MLCAPAPGHSSSTRLPCNARMSITDCRASGPPQPYAGGGSSIIIGQCMHARSYRGTVGPVLEGCAAGDVRNSQVAGRAVHHSHVLVVELSGSPSERLGAVAVAADDAPGASAVVAVAGEDLIHQRPHLVDDNPEGRHLQAQAHTEGTDAARLQAMEIHKPVYCSCNIHTDCLSLQPLAFKYVSLSAPGAHKSDTKAIIVVKKHPVQESTPDEVLQNMRGGSRTVLRPLTTSSMGSGLSILDASPLRRLSLH